jgi:hypothetical protein
MSQSISKKQILDVMDPFARVERINRDLNISDDTPLIDVLPGVWPTYGDIKKLYAVANLMGWTSDYRK